MILRRSALSLSASLVALLTLLPGDITGQADLAKTRDIQIEAAALRQDPGKRATPEHIRKKPGRLTPAEFDIMKRHAPVGAEILSTIDFPYPVVPIVRHHHENWDGTGYPDRLRGEQIPVGARILSVVDCFDALTSDRPYRPRLSTAAALEILRERRGWMYDPQVVDTFLRLADEFVVEDNPQEAPPHEDRMAAISGSIHALAEADRRGGGDDETDAFSRPSRCKTQHMFGTVVPQIMTA